MRFLAGFFLILFSFQTFAEDDDALMPGDITLSIGAGKDNMPSKGFIENAVPYEIPVQLMFGVTRQLELGLEYAPYSMSDARVGKRQYRSGIPDSLLTIFTGYMHTPRFVLNYSVENNYRYNGYLQLKGGYTYFNGTDTQQGEETTIKGNGFTYALGGGMRYQLGNEYDDVFPFFFDFGIYYSRFNIKPNEVIYEQEPVAIGDALWDPLKFGSIDVVFRFGYRFKTKK